VVSRRVIERASSDPTLAKQLNKGRQLSAEVVGGLTQGEQPLGGRGSDTEPKCRVDPNDGCAAGDERN
jgi:hypothetical protein